MPIEKPITFHRWGEKVSGKISIDRDLKRIYITTEDEDVPGCPTMYAICTTQLPGIEKDEVAIKNWSENEGMLDLLLDEGIVMQPHRWVRSGFVNVPICYWK